MNREVCLVACSGAKVAMEPWQRIAARDLYASDLFAKSRAYAEARCGDHWAILSAKHGLLLPDTRIGTYDMALNDMTAWQRRTWAQSTRSQLLGAFGQDARYVVLAGRHYRSALVGLQIEVPLEGLGIGQQKAWLKRWSENHR